MNHAYVRGGVSGEPVSAALGNVETGETVAFHQRSVHRAASDLKRGVPVLLGAPEPLVIVPAETVSAPGLRELAEIAVSPLMLVLASTRAVKLLPRALESTASAVAFRLPLDLLSVANLRGLADPTAEQLLDPSALMLETAPGAAAAALALAKIARLLPAMLVARASPDALARADRMQLLHVSADHVLAYAGTAASELIRVAEARVPLEDAPDARVVAFRAPDAGIEHLAILIGRPETRSPGEPAPLVRVHSECFTGDLLGSLRCDCGPQLRGALKRMAAEGCGALLYLAQEGRGIGLVNKLRAYALQDRGLDTIDANRALGWGADERNFLVAATMLDLLQIPALRLLTNNPDKVAGLAACGIIVEQRERHVVAPNGVNDSYLATKADRFGHLFG